MKRYFMYLCDTLLAHGVPVGNRRPALIPPVDPRNSAHLTAAIQDAARQAYIHGDKGSPQLICCVLPGRLVFTIRREISKLMRRDAWLYENIKRVSFTELKGQ